MIHQAGAAGNTRASELAPMSLRPSKHDSLNYFPTKLLFKNLKVANQAIEMNLQYKKP